jgi:hypothetical protein
MTLGEERVRVSFNPGGKPLVEEIKRKTAALIDLCAKLRAEVADSDRPQHELGEIFRCISLAQTHFEDAAMWAVKAATAP